MLKSSAIAMGLGARELVYEVSIIHKNKLIKM